MKLKAGDRVYTPRFCTVRIKERRPLRAEKRQSAQAIVKVPAMKSMGSWWLERLLVSTGWSLQLIANRKEIV